MVVRKALVCVRVCGRNAVPNYKSICGVSHMSHATSCEIQMSSNRVIVAQEDSDSVEQSCDRCMLTAASEKENWSQKS